jgi:hypothetical protein
MGTTRSLKINGAQTYLHPISYKSKSYPDCDTEGNPVFRKIKGKGTTVFEKEDGTEVPKMLVRKLVDMPDGTQKPMSPLKATAEVKANELEGDVKTELGSYQKVEMLHVVNTQDKGILKDIIQDGKSYTFPFVGGRGFRIRRAIMTEFNGKIVIYGCEGSAKKAVEDFQFDEEIELEGSMATSVTENEMESMMGF